MLTGASNVSQSIYRRRGAKRWRMALLVLLIPCVLCASAIRVARATSYKSQPIVSDGVDDDADASVICGLAEDTAKKSALTNVRALPGRKLLSSVETLPQLAKLQTHQRPFSDSAFRSKHLPREHRVCPEHPDGAH